MGFLTNDKVNEEATFAPQNPETSVTLESDFIDKGEAETAKIVPDVEETKETMNDIENVEHMEKNVEENMENPDSKPSIQESKDLSVLQLIAKYKSLYESLIDYSCQLLKKSPKCCLCRDEQSDCAFLAKTKCNTYDSCMYDALNEAIANMARVEEVILRLQKEAGYADGAFEVNC